MAKLNALSLAEQHSRIQTVFDKTVENCCIFPMLFKPGEIGPGRLSSAVRSSPMSGWREEHYNVMRSHFTSRGASVPSDGKDKDYFKVWVEALGTPYHCLSYGLLELIHF